MKKIKIFSIILAILLIFSACGKTGTENGETGLADNSNENNTAEAAEVDFSKTDDDMFSKRDLETSTNESKDNSGNIQINLNGNSISCSDNSVQIAGTTATITGDGTYILSGTLNDGMIIVNAGDKDKPQLILNGVTINSATSAPIYVLNADKVFVTLAQGTTNKLSNGGTFTAIDENNIDAVIFAKDDLTLNGSGSLTVNSPAGHGIVCKDDLVLAGGTYTVNSASHGLDANDSIRITNTTLTIDAGKDGIHSENSDDASLGYIYISSGTFDISAEGDGISAESTMQIEGGTFNIVSGGGSVNASKQTSDSWGGFMGGFMGGNRGPSSNSSSNTTDSSTSIKGIKVAGSLLISGGTFTIDSADDAVHSNETIVVNGGTFNIATGDDGFHADESLTITAGTIDITESYEGLEALNVKIAGGNIKLVATDDGINAAGGADSSGFGGMRGNDTFGGFGGGRGGQGGPGGPGGGGSSSSNGTIVISGGTIYVKASGDGIDANGTLEITGGHITVCGPTQGDTATLDYDVSGVITGGTFIGTGAAGMAQSFSDSEQGVIAVKTGNQAAGTQIVLKDKSGKTLISYKPELSFQIVILSTPDLVKGETYSLTVGSLSQDIKAS